MDKKILFLDMDEVMTKTISEVLNRYNEEYQDNLNFNDIVEWDLRLFQKKGADILKYFYKENFFLNLKPYEDALECVPKLYEHFNVFITTVPSGVRSMVDKISWLKKYFPFIEERKVIFIHDKSLLQGDIIIDDNLSFVEKANVQKRILIKKPWNKTNSEDIIIAKNLKEATKFLLN